MKKIFHWLLNPSVTGPSSLLIIRWMIATIYIWESFVKLLDGTPISLIAAGEIIASILLLLGLFTRITCILFIVEIIASPLTTGTSFFTPLEYTQILTCFYLVLEGPGRRSLDFRISTANKVYRMS